MSTFFVSSEAYLLMKSAAERAFVRSTSGRAVLLAVLSLLESRVDTF